MRARKGLVLSVSSWRILFFVLAIALFALRTPSYAQECSWREFSYGGGGRFTAVAVDPANPSQVFVGSDVAGYYKSIDGGRTFKNLGQGLGGLAVASIALDPDHPGRMFVLSDDGLYVSQDSGRTVTNVLPRVRYASRFFGSHLLARHQGQWYAAGNSDGVFRLDELADEKWKAVPLFGLEGKKVNALIDVAGRLTAATDEGVFYHDGEIWKSMNEGFAPGHRDIVDMAAHSSGRLYALEKKYGLYKYDQRTNRFERLGPNPMTLPSKAVQLAFKVLTVAPDNPDVVFLGTHPESWPSLLMRSQDGGRTFSLVKRFTLDGSVENWAKDLQAPEQMVFSPDGRVAFLLDWWNVWRSSDAGDTWLQVHKGLQNTVVNQIVRDPADPAKIHLAVDDNGLMISPDNGKTWRRKMEGVIEGHAASVWVSARTPGLLYLLVNPWHSPDTADAKYYHLYKSVDAGEHWVLYRIHDKQKSLDKSYADSRATGLTVDPNQENIVYVATNGFGVYKVDAGGQAPQGDVAPVSVTAALPSECFKGQGAFLIDAANPKVFLAAVLGGGIFRSEDAGASWHLVAAPRGFVFSMAQDPDHPKTFYAAASEKHVLKSQDGGLTWHWIDLPGSRQGNIAACAVAVADGAVWIGTAGYNHLAGDGIFVSRDGGETFTRCVSDIPRAAVNVLAPQVGAKPPASLVGFNGLGVYEVRAPKAER